MRTRFSTYDTYDDYKCTSDREGEEEYDLGDMCKPCFNGQHKRCTRQSGTFAGRACSCYAAHSPVWHPKQSGKLTLKMEQL